MFCTDKRKAGPGFPGGGAVDFYVGWGQRTVTSRIHYANL